LNLIEGFETTSKDYIFFFMSKYLKNIVKLTIAKI